MKDRKQTFKALHHRSVKDQQTGGSMLQVKNLTIQQEKDLRTLISDLHLTINKGEKAAIIGEEGNGKSSLLQVLFGRVPAYISYEGEIIPSFKKGIYIPQQLAEKDLTTSLNDYIFGENDSFLDYAKLYRYADELQFDSQRFSSSQLLSQLSGGETFKTQLIKSLAQDFDMLFLDEPSNDLDLDTLVWLEHYIKNSSKTILFVSHDEALLTKTAHKIIHLEMLKKKREAKTTVMSLDYQDYCKHRQTAFQHQYDLAANQRREHDKKTKKLQEIHQKVQQTLQNTHDSTAGRLVAKKMKSVLSQGQRYDREAAQFAHIPSKEDAIDLRFSDICPLSAAKTILQLEQFQLQVGDMMLAKSITFSLKGQEKIGIIGRNGVGKSSLLKKIFAMLKEQKQLSISYIPQQYSDCLDEEKTAPAFLGKTGEQAERTLILNHLACLHFTKEEIKHPIKDLSGGQKAKLLLLQAVLAQPQVLLLDEPSRNFSPTSQPVIRSIFRNYPGALIAVSHDRTFLKEVCNKVYLLTEDGLTKTNLEELG